MTSCARTSRMGSYLGIPSINCSKMELNATVKAHRCNAKCCRHVRTVGLGLTIPLHVRDPWWRDVTLYSRHRWIDPPIFIQRSVVSQCAQEQSWIRVAWLCSFRMHTPANSVILYNLWRCNLLRQPWCQLLIRPDGLTRSDSIWFEDKWLGYEFNFFYLDRGRIRFGSTWPD
jgi:hypothetical protein